MKGMAQALKVVAPPAGTAPAPAGPADLTINLSNYKFELSDSLTGGSKTIDVVVAPGQPHELAILRLLPGKTMDDFMKWGTTYQGPVPVSVVGGTTAAVAGIHQPDGENGKAEHVLWLIDAAARKLVRTS
jgi:hypothetical protein